MSFENNKGRPSSVADNLDKFNGVEGKDIAGKPDLDSLKRQLEEAKKSLVEQDEDLNHIYEQNELRSRDYEDPHEFTEAFRATQEKHRKLEATEEQIDQLERQISEMEQ